jgi:cytochrome c-type biogenesis protein CcmH/NrfG
MAPAGSGMAYGVDNSAVRAAAVSYLSAYMDPLEAEAGATALGDLSARLTAVLPLVIVFLVPVFGLCTWAAWRQGGLPYATHLNFALDVHAALCADECWQDGHG